MSIHVYEQEIINHKHALISLLLSLQSREKGFGLTGFGFFMISIMALNTFKHL